MRQLKTIVAFVFAAQVAFATSPVQEIKPPEKPNLDNCIKKVTIQTMNGQEEIEQTDFACKKANDEKIKEYNQGMAIYNKQQQALANVKQVELSEAQKKLAEQQSSLQAMKDAQKKNEQGNQIYQLASIGCGVVSAVFAAKFAASCSGGGTCQPSFLYTSLAFAGFSVLAMMQANKNKQTAQSACNSANKVSSSGGTDCGAPIPDYNPNTWPGTTISDTYDQNGKCKKSPEECKALDNQLAGMNIKDKKGVSGFGGAGAKLPFKVNADGSLTTKDGKTFTMDNFKDEKSMLAMGMSPLDAKNLANSLKQMPSSENVAKVPEKNEDLAISGSFDSMSGGVGKSGGSLANNGAYTAPVEQKREVASAEGLARDYNGELIGVSSDDIFKMMNRRYNLKNKQDSFIAP